MITIVQCKDAAALQITNDVTFEDIKIMFQNTEDANEMIYKLLRGTIESRQLSD